MSEIHRGDGAVASALFAHNTWANLKLLDFCAGLTDEQLDATAIGCYGSIRATLIHIFYAEVSYVHRATGKYPATAFSREQFPGFPVLKETARWAGNELLALALSAQTATLVTEDEPPLRAEYPLSSLIVQAITHAVEHRTHIAAIITQAGLESPDMSTWAFMEATGQFKELTIS